MARLWLLAYRGPTRTQVLLIASPNQTPRIPLRAHGKASLGFSSGSLCSSRQDPAAM